ncbi:hypothetical protein KI387_007190 [Taxus chinensis]|uniref:AP2/ERF domain-containing protein n=1 Tax=Taxus chinensis TaxID=29808 RepID=A0AA38GP19_TAXCH|nr:hypothetical protein KI387_007190 [Taxus chinensis]
MSTLTAHSYSLRSAIASPEATPPPEDFEAVMSQVRHSHSGGGFEARIKKRKKFVGVRQRPSGRWVAEIKDTTQKIRMWLGTFETAEEAARAYDEAACLLRGSNTRTNFATDAPKNNSAMASRIKRLLSLRKDSGADSKPKPNSVGDQSPSNSCGAAIQSNFVDGENGSTSFLEYLWPPFDLGSSDIQLPAFPAMDDQLSVICDQGRGNQSQSRIEEIDFCEQSIGFSRMKFERRVSANLYAFNGVQDYFLQKPETPNFSSSSSFGEWNRKGNSSFSPNFYENLNNQGGPDALWDLPPLCKT